MAACIPENLLVQSPSAGSAAQLRHLLVPSYLAARSLEQAAAKQAGCLLQLLIETNDPKPNAVTSQRINPFPFIHQVPNDERAKAR